MRNLIFIFVVIVVSIQTSGQTIVERLIVSDNKDSLLLNARQKAFDKDGNYSFHINKKDQNFFVSNRDTMGSFKSIGSIYGQSGEISFTKSYSDSKDTPFYYKNSNGTRVFGNAKGKIECYQTSRTRENIAITTTFNDSVYKYINGRLVAQNHKDKVERTYISESSWVSFSENGNSIYFIKQDSIFKLFVNEILIDSSKFQYNQLAINNNGDYIFAKGRKPEQAIGKYTYMFYIHSKDTVLDYVRTVWDYQLTEKGAYFYSGDDNGPYYIAINDKLHKNIKPVANITLIDKETYLYSFTENGEKKINANGKIHTHDFEKISYPSIDKNGNSAYFGLKDYYLYKVVNGQKIEKPLSKYGVRAMPIYISPKGESLHYFITDDSIYLYRDEQLIFEPISKKSNFSVQTHKDVFSPLSSRGKAGNGQSLVYLEYENRGYFIYNGVFSEPFIPIIEKDYYKEKFLGEIISGELNQYGYYVIQKIGKKKYRLAINNQFYHEFDQLDYILDNNIFFDGKSLTFYALKKRSFYQFKIIL